MQVTNFGAYWIAKRGHKGGGGSFTRLTTIKYDKLRITEINIPISHFMVVNMKMKKIVRFWRP